MDELLIMMLAGLVKRKIDLDQVLAKWSLFVKSVSLMCGDNENMRHVSKKDGISYKVDLYWVVDCC